MFGVPLFERGGVDLDDAVFDQSFGSDQFIVRGVVNDIHNFSFFGNLINIDLRKRDKCRVGK
jgi:hypothetical protein